MEKDIEKRLVDGISKWGGKVYKFISPGNAGVPDRIVILPGENVFFVELKDDRGELSKLQKAQIRKLRSLGVKVFILRGMIEVENFLKYIDSVKLDSIRQDMFN